MKKLIILIISVIILFGCATTGKLRNLQLRMTKQEVTSAMKKPGVARGSLMNKYGQAIDVWEYGLFKSGDDAFHGILTYYWLYFYEGTLVQWGQSGDWQPDKIYDIKFK